MGHSAGEVTKLLVEMGARGQNAAPKLFELLYQELRRMAQGRLKAESPDHTLQATALVHEAYLRLVDNRQPLQNSSHFFGVASTAMRRVLVDHARAKRAAKRPGSLQKVDLEQVPLYSNERCDDLIALDSALEKLTRMDPRQGKIVEMRYFGGLTSGEIADALAISPVTAQRDWVVAKAWLHAELAGRAAAP